MKLLIIGNGGREHALAWKISKSPLVSKIYCAPGNGGTSEIADNIPISADDLNGLTAFAEKEKIDLTVVGPEVPLTLGIVDQFSNRGLKAFGVSKRAAILESSKVFAKEFMQRYSIPTAEYKIFENPDNAKKYIQERNAPIVIKADGLAAGKGAVVCHSIDEALKIIDMIMVDRQFGNAGNKIVVEEFLKGEEASFLVITDGKTILPLAPSQDHKQIYDEDKGPNTGGMGAYSPAPVIKGMEREDRIFKGVLYAGIMICNNKPKVLEFNVRFGDPETQPILMRIESDIVPIFLKTIDSSLEKCSFKWSKDAATCVIMASEGYPGKYDKGIEITGLDSCKGDDTVMVFHAGTEKKDGKIVTSGGRVLGVTAVGKDIMTSIIKAYAAVSKISFSGAYYRRDIGKKAIDK